MKRHNFILSIYVGLALSASLTALSFLADKVFAIPFVPFSLFNWMVPLVPGPVITFGIDAMIDTMLLLQMNVANSAKTAEQVMAILLFLVLAAITGGLAFHFGAAGRRKRFTKILGVLTAISFSIFIIAVSLQRETNISTIAGLILLFALWLFAIEISARIISAMKYSEDSIRPIPPDASPEEIVETLRSEEGKVEQLSRRQFLVTIGTSAAAVTVMGTGLGLFLSADDRRRASEAAGDYVPSHTLPNANDPVTPAPGTRWEYTPLAEHYKVFLEIEASKVEAAGYSLPITGLVENPLELSLDDLYNRWPSRDQYITLSCISGRVGTTLISTTKWTGISMQDILAEAGVQSTARYLYIESADGFHESVPLELIEQDPRIMLCHSWDDQPLPDDHGFPCRIWIPDRFGMKQPKWIVRMELMEEYIEGYWVERGWDEVARVKTTSVIDTVAVENIAVKNGQRVVPVGGIAWAGDRQISRVEVRVDGGKWEPAALRNPLSDTTWVVWRYDWPFDAGNHLFEVRTFELDGTSQIEEEARARPSGATGIHNVEVEI